jgi:hypothetical protein
VFAVTVDGDQGSRVSRAFAEFFTGMEFRTAASGNNYTLKASLAITDLDISAGQQNKFVRHVLTVYLADKKGVELFSYTDQARSGHITESEARQLALRKVEASIKEGDFAEKFNDYLNSLLK